MTNQDLIYKRALDKAIAKGYTCGDKIHHGQKDCVTFLTEDYDRPSRETVIFSHSFAKAFWGEEKTCGHKQTMGQDYKCQCSILAPAWQYHLQQMVLEKNPLKYLERFL